LAAAVVRGMAEERMGRAAAGLGVLRLRASVVCVVSELAIRRAGGSRGDLLRLGVSAGPQYPRFHGDARTDGHHVADFLFLTGHPLTRGVISKNTTTKPGLRRR